jgi:hypothetical protein
MSDEGTSDNKQSRYKRINPNISEDEPSGTANWNDEEESQVWPNATFWMGFACGLVAGVAAVALIDRSKDRHYLSL